jgi:hypothetical protein
MDALTSPAAPGVTLPSTPDNWKPHHAGILGQIADYILGTHFGRENESRNMQGALEHFQTNPQEAINRLMQVNPDAAVKLYDKVTDNNREQGTLTRQNRALDGVLENQVLNRTANMMGAANEKNWAQMREQAIAYGNSHGFDVSPYVSQTYDPDGVDLMRAGAVPVKAQIAQQETHDYHAATTDYRNKSLTERDNYHQERIGIDKDRVGIAQQNANTSAKNAGTSAGRLDETKRHNGVTETRLAANGAKGSRGTVQTKYGPAVISKDGKTMTLFPDKRSCRCRLRR